MFKNLKLSLEDYAIMEAEIKKYNLIVPTYWYNFTPYARRKVFNGAGSDETPVILRYIITKILSIFGVAIWIHDFCYQYKYCKKQYADDIFLVNMNKLINTKISRWNILYRGYMHSIKHIVYNTVINLGNEEGWEEVG